MRLPALNEENAEMLDKLFSQHGFTMKLIPNDQALSADALSDCEVLFGTFPIDALANTPSLRWIHSSLAGVDKIVSSEVLSGRNITLTNSAGAFGISISEYILTCILMLMKRMPGYLQNQKEHLWKPLSPAKSIFGSTICILGLGNIGSSFARQAKSMGANILAVKRIKIEPPDYIDGIYTSDELDKVLPLADVIVSCLPSTPLTKNMLNKDKISMFKKGAIFVNVGRGDILDEDALYCSLKSGALGGAVLDVTRNEPLDPKSPLWDMPSVIITPHISGSNYDKLNISKILEIFIENFKRYIAGSMLCNIIDNNKGY